MNKNQRLLFYIFFVILVFLLACFEIIFVSLGSLQIACFLIIVEVILILSVAAAGIYYLENAFFKVEKLSKENMKLHYEVDDALLDVRERYIKGILQGELPEHDRLDAFLEKYNISFCSNIFSVLSLTMIDESVFFSGMGENNIEFSDMVRVRKTVTHVFEIQLCDIAQFELARVDDDLAAILSFKVSSTDPLVDEEKLIKKTQVAVNEALKILDSTYGLKMGAFISSPFISIYSICKAYLQAQTLRGYVDIQCKAVSLYDIEENLVDKRELVQRSDSERQIYNAFVSYDFRLVKKTLLDRIDIDASDPSITFLRIKSDISARLDFLISTLGISWLSASPSLNDTTRYFADIKESQSIDEIKTAVINFCDCLENYWSSQMKNATNYAEKIKIYIKDNYTDPNMNAAMVCNHFGISQAYLSRMFKQKTGVGVLEFIHKTRIEKVKSLLSENDSTLQVIAERVGYSSARALTQAFKRYEGITPDAWRKLCNKSNASIDE